MTVRQRCIIHAIHESYNDLISATEYPTHISLGMEDY